MSQTVSVRPINSLVFVSDKNGGQPPEPVRGEMFWSTSSCIAVPCYPEQEGPTNISVGQVSEVNPGGAPNFERELETPNRVVIISTVDEQILLEAKVESSRTHVRIWINHDQWPDNVTIGLG